MKAMQFTFFVFWILVAAMITGCASRPINPPISQVDRNPAIGSAGRSELAAEYYDEVLFDNATFADLLAKPGPVALATGTDNSTGSRLAFLQNDFTCCVQI